MAGLGLKLGGDSKAHPLSLSLKTSQLPTSSDGLEISLGKMKFLAI